MNSTLKRYAAFIPIIILVGLHYFLNQMKVETFQFIQFAILYSVMIPCFIIVQYYNKKKCYSIQIVIVYFIVVSLIYLWSSPVLSDDAYRYIWEGHVQNKGYNPFLVPPASPVFNGESLISKINFPEITAVYPPLMQLVFRALSSISVSMWFFKIFFVVAAFITMLILYKKREVYEDTYFVWTFLPLTIMETAWSGHLDSIGVLFFLVSVLFLERSKGLFAGLFLALSVSSKWMPIMFVPVYFFSLPKNERLSFISMLLFIPILYIPYLSAGKMLFFALFNFANHWWHDTAMYMLLKLMGISESGTRIVLMIFFIASYVIIFLKAREIRNKIYLILLSLTHLSPVLWPWYLLWLVPFGVVSFPYTTITQALLSFGSYYCLETGYISSHYSYTVLMSVVRTVIVIAVFTYEIKKQKSKSICKEKAVRI